CAELTHRAPDNAAHRGLLQRDAPALGSGGGDPEAQAGSRNARPPDFVRIVGFFSPATAASEGVGPPGTPSPDLFGGGGGPSSALCRVPSPGDVRHGPLTWPLRRAACPAVIRHVSSR